MKKKDLGTRAIEGWYRTALKEFNAGQWRRWFSTGMELPALKYDGKVFIGIEHYERQRDEVGRLEKALRNTKDMLQDLKNEAAWLRLPEFPRSAPVCPVCGGGTKPCYVQENYFDRIDWTCECGHKTPTKTKDAK